MSIVLFEQEGGLARITLNRPEKYNSFNREMALALQDILDQCAADESIRSILLTGAGKGFCAGQDLSEASDPDTVDFERIVSEHYNPLILKIRNLEKPVVCAVNGVAAGAGANIALACDIVVATESASFIQAFSKIGLIPDSAGTFFLPRYTGMQRAAALMMLGAPVSATEAAAMGMIYKAFPDASFQEESQKLAASLAQMATKGIGLTKRLLNQSYGNSLEEQLKMEMQVQVEAGSSHDFKEGVQAFLEKRKPVFQGN